MEALYVRYVIPLKNYLMFDCLGGPRPLQLRYVINLQKGGTFPAMLFLMYYFDNWSMAAYLYTANHGSYGLVWLLKDLILPDKAWTPYITIPSTIVTALVLVGYWGAGYIVIAHRVEVSPGLACLCTTMNILGTVLMIGADTQKFFQLKYKPGLIEDGWVTWSRNTNYLGEMMLYLSFALLARHLFPFAVLALIWSLLFLSNMTTKELSFRNKEGGPAYMARTGFLIPNVGGWLSRFMAPMPKARTS
ncbi:hypothetical protein SDRG_13567 [Saprolegnia diclina VS20]|uniref:Uncharacterized protein n=1 Tax=Saprolegnia diclina (strain VS20) TaxID=1156394 RepID=T0RG73_SAPDV|nr:hypothetical protein SDRG_13567 [Saprolegnia diclina VS20]EQC28692.1 hypothetical protein SDRG_13567 [Saprolegnia diclina VS20]|eukprot:XP_008617884.1 hypothetical protein SDRG_13567 [Saprolegnia diclina VS20]